jgi:hypothetical protein
MYWVVSFRLTDGRTVVVSVIATNRSDAEYRGAVKAEGIYKTNVERVLRCARQRGSHA